VVPHLDVEHELVHPFIYVAAPFERAAYVKQIHDMLTKLDFGFTSTWVEASTGGAEPFKGEEAMRLAAESNDTCVLDADALLVLAYPGQGAEMFCEMSLALQHKKPVFYVGQRIVLSAYRSGVMRFPSLLEAVRALAAWFEVEMRGDFEHPALVEKMQDEDYFKSEGIHPSAESMRKAAVESMKPLWGPRCSECGAWSKEEIWHRTNEIYGKLGSTANAEQDLKDLRRLISICPRSALKQIFSTADGIGYTKGNLERLLTGRESKIL